MRIICFVFCLAFSAPAFGQSADLVWIEVRDIETDTLIRSAIVPDDVVHLLAEGIYYSFHNTAYLVQLDKPKRNNTTKRKNRPGYAIPSFKI